MDERQRKQTSRRRFLTSSAVTAAAVAGLPAVALAADIDKVHVVPNNGSVGGVQAINPRKYIAVWVELEEAASQEESYEVVLECGDKRQTSEKKAVVEKGKLFSTTVEFEPFNPAEPTKGKATATGNGMEKSKPLHFRKQ